MSQKLINRSPDLARLRSDGFNIEIRSAYLLVKDVPYVNEMKEVKRGILAAKLHLAGDITARPDDHQVQLVGEYPCHGDGSRMTELVNQSKETKLAENLTTNHWFSHKPRTGYYKDYHEMMTTYIAILTSQARAIDPGVTAQVFQIDEAEDEETPFNYLDTASGRAEIGFITKKLALDRVAIIGIGGTGSYILDNLAKLPIKEIHIFDGDKLSTHNAFRAPGAPSIEELRAQPDKVDYFKARYDKMHRGIIAHGYDIGAGNVDELREMNFVFLSIDVGDVKRLIVEKLEEFEIPFIDVGMGLYAKNEKIGGIVRVTTSTPQQREHVHEKSRIPFGKIAKDAVYDQNIQTPELNALNAVLAVIRWKKLYGFYADNEHEHYTTYTIDCNLLTSEDIS